MLTNIRSLRYEVDELSTVIENNGVDVCCVTESWLDDNIPTVAVDIAGFNCYRRDRINVKTGGGVVCYINKK